MTNLARLGFRIAMFSWLLLIAAGCSTKFPPPTAATKFTDGHTAEEIFANCLSAHGGDVRTFASDVNLSIDGQWSSLIQRIQPIVTDSAFRITSEERFHPREQLYAAQWRGPAGTKTVVRTPDSVEVYYNGVQETNNEKRQASAMTADAFQLFHLGPSFLQMRDARFSRLSNLQENGVSYQRLRTTLRPGFGFSESDDVVVWIHPGTHRLFRVHLTLNGFKTTQGAHVDTTFLEYRQIGQMLVPTELDERVRGPIRIHAHRWHLTGADVNRGWRVDDVRGAGLQGLAAEPARKF
jgi:hypothetical protein